MGKNISLAQCVHSGDNSRNLISTLILQVKCVFFTDGLQLDGVTRNKLSIEHSQFGDIKFSPTEDATILFGERLLYHMLWAKAKFNFQYFLRLDDDYFVCMEKLTNELPSRPKKNLSWGWYHCQQENLVYKDESWTLFSEDVIEQFFAQDLRSIMCHPFGDQMIAFWVKAAKINLTIFDDRRLHHHPPAANVKKFLSMSNICDKYMGLHGSYSNILPHFWRNSNDGPKNITSMTLLSHTCHRKHAFDINLVGGIYNFTLKQCLDRPRWNMRIKSWGGREEGQQ